MIARLGASMRCAPVLALAVIASVLAGNSAWAASLTLDSGRGAGQVAVIAGKDGRQQFIATFVDDAGLSRDVTREAKYEASPAGIVSVDASGLAIPQSEGVATITAVGPDGVKAQAEVRVEHFEVDLPINFPNEIVPIFTKNGCNGGGCHGKASGQNGFKLSLLGFEPREDFEFLTKEARGRRLFPAAPERSLLLAKGTAQVPHGGGARLEADSPAYRMVHRWIAQGMPYGSDADPVATRIEVFPRDRVMTKEASQQLVVIAHYTDGSTRDVTRMTTLTSNDAEMAEVSPAGLVKTHGQTGTVAVMCIFQGHVDVFRATLPLGVEVTNLPEPANFVDELVFNQLKRLGLPPSAVCDDATFLRRVTIALAGRVPTLAEAQAFNADQDSNKRAAAIARLVDSTDYADNFATKWSAILRNKRSKDEDKRATFAFHSWIRDSLYENKPYDQFVRDIVTATGEVSVFPPVAWYRELREPSAMVEDTAQLFLGMRIQCARCHHHPFEKWSQRDYHSFSAFYSRLGRKPTQFAGQDQIFHQQGQPTAQNPKTGEQLVPAGLDAQPPAISPLDDPRDALVDWMTQKDNPFFAKALVNRYWKHFFGRGLVDPEDDMRVTNPASNPELLDALAQDFVDHQFDLKYLVSLICNSKTYQLSAEPNEYNQNDKQNYARFYPRRLDAETMLDAIDQVTGVPTAFAGMPAGVRAGQLPDNGFQNYFLTVFGRPEASSACECERSTDASLAQSLHLLNSQDILGKVAFDQGRAAKMAGEERPFEQRIRELYLLAFSREPDAEEMEIARKYVESKKSSREAFEDVVWALVNTKEFLFNH